jgi:membrane-bound acyltransferase YfiQ involved in biofilm formation
MTVSNYLQEAGALATLSGILAGFAFSAVVQFLSNPRSGRVYTATIVVFSVAALMFMFSLIIFVLGFAAAAELDRVPTELDGWGTYALLVLLGAVYLLLSGIALAGWIRSRAAGIAATAFVLITMCLTTWGIGSVISLFVK